ncbi:hypothetical protein [Actinomadura sp. 3N407]|uniref:hypothetical protein n=1 Tax=Actinomadura sp. 3N407 TaxID=3457423 RepID=UPI003FCD439B
MRCQGCGNDTNPALPRCTRCNAPLGTSPGGDATAPDRHGGDATAHDPPADDATARDPLGGAPGPGEPLPPPWTSPPQDPVQWESPPPGPPPDHTTPMPPSGETSTQLSPEPWAEPVSPEPWAEPAIWQPPAPPKRSRVPYFLAAAGAVLLIGVALGIVFWPSGSGTPAQPGDGVPSAAQSQGTEPATEEPGDDGDVEAQAGAVDDLLKEMGGTRSDLGGVVVDGCPADGLRRVLDARQGQLDQARALDVRALDNGVQMKDALVRALEASTESNQRYLDVAPGCPTEAEVADVNQRASDAKSEFIDYWTPVAEQAGLPARTESDI